MKAIHAFAATLLLATTLPLALPARGQTVTPSPTPARQGTEPVRFSFQFKDVPLSQAARFLQSKDPETNVVVGPGAENLLISEMDLRNVTTMQAANFISGVLGDQVILKLIDNVPVKTMETRLHRIRCRLRGHLLNLLKHEP